MCEHVNRLAVAAILLLLGACNQRQESSQGKRPGDPRSEAAANQAIEKQLRTRGETAERERFALQHLAIGKKTPDIEGEDLNGRRFKLSDLKGKVVLLVFWGSW
jgi:cytochrome oxidase Cu insertion factor (SCO1/SenC/PrrC family)